MAQGPTNVNLIASYIHSNPGCRRTDIKRHLFLARIGEEPKDGRHNRVSNQYFQNYGSCSNVYLNRLWYNSQREGIRDSSYQLTWAGQNKVFSKDRLIRPFKTGQLVEWQWQSPRRHGWEYVHHQSMRGLVIDRNETYGMWVLALDGIQKFLSHHAWIREAQC